MADVVVFTGSVAGSLRGVNAISGSEQGTTTFGFQFNSKALVGATAPDIVSGGGYQGQFTAVTGGTLLNLADATNIVKSGGAVVGGGTIAPGQGYGITGVAKLRAIYLENTDATKTVTVTIPGSNGLAGLGWVASAVVVVLQPAAQVLLVFPAGSSVLTAGSNDGLVFTSSSGSPIVNIGVFAG